MANTKVSTADFGNEITKLLNEFGQEAFDVLNDSISAVAKESQQELKDNSPKRTGNYSKSWKVTKMKCPRFFVGYVVHNGKYYRLTHLLEYGHAKSNGDGRTQAQPHIFNVNEKAQERVFNEMQRRLSK